MMRNFRYMACQDAKHSCFGTNVIFYECEDPTYVDEQVSGHEENIVLVIESLKIGDSWGNIVAIIESDDGTAALFKVTKK